MNKFFLITLPNKRSFLYRCNGWFEVNYIAPFISDDYTEKVFIKPLTTWQAIKYVFGGKVC